MYDYNSHFERTELAEKALHKACAYIQDKLGQDTGDVAGIFFTGEDETIIIDILRRYIETEINEIEKGEQQ